MSHHYQTRTVVAARHHLKTLSARTSCTTPREIKATTMCDRNTPRRAHITRRRLLDQRRQSLKHVIVIVIVVIIVFVVIEIAANA
jgi:hypothetical protein